MFLECIKNEQGDVYLIKLQGSDCRRIRDFIEEIYKLVRGERTDISVHELSGFESIKNCKLFMSVGERDKEIIFSDDKKGFVWTLSTESLIAIAELMEPLIECVDTPVYQWLCGKEVGFLSPVSPISFLVTIDADGRW